MKSILYCIILLILCGLIAELKAESLINPSDTQWLPYGSNCMIKEGVENSLVAVDFDDTTTTAWFNKGVIASFKKPAQLDAGAIISFKFKASAELTVFHLLIQEVDGDFWKAKIECPPSNAEFRIVDVPLRNFRYGWNDKGNKTGEQLNTGIERIFFSAYVDQQKNSGKKYYMEILGFSISNSSVCQYQTRPAKSGKIAVNFSNISDRGNFTANGKEFFPLGIYTTIGVDEASSQFTKYNGTFSAEIVDGWLKKIKDAGFNVVQTYGLQYYGMKTLDDKINTDPACLAEGTVKFLDALDKHNLKSLSNIHYYKQPTISRTADGSNDWGTRQSHIKTIVSAIKDHPALWSYYLSDEPGNSKVPVEDIKMHYDFLKTLDKNHPALTVCCFYSEIKNYGHLTDIIAPDPYPAAGNQPLTVATDYICEVEKKQNCGNPVSMFVVGIGFHKLRPDKDKLLVETYLPVCRNVKGLLFFDFSDMKEYPLPEIAPDHWKNISDIINSLHPLEAVLLSNELIDSYTVGNRNICSIMKKVRENGRNYYYLIAVNPLEKAIPDSNLGKVEITLKDLSSSNHLPITVLNESAKGEFELQSQRTIDSFVAGESLRFTDNFGPCTVHIYKIGPLEK